MQREATQLPDLSSEQDTVERPPPPRLDLGWLPFAHYRNPFDPFDLTAETELGDLADDLLDIAHDLADGFAQLDDGNLANAVWVWRSSYWFHWSEHLSGAVWALHRWLALRC